MVTNFPNMCNPFVEEQKLWYKFVWLQHWVLLHPNDSQKEFQTKFFKFGFQWGFTDSINFSNTIFFFFLHDFFFMTLNTKFPIMDNYWPGSNCLSLYYLLLYHYYSDKPIPPFSGRSITVHVCISYDAYP